MRQLLIPLLITIPTLAFVGCGGTKITRVDASQQVDLSGNWNATDSQQVAKTMIADVMTRPWVTNFMTKEGRKPRVQVDQVIVRSNGDIIETEIFTNDMVREFINSGQVSALSDLAMRQRQNQVLQALDANASEESRKNAFAQISPDFILRGTILVQDDQAGDTRQRFYSIDLNLSDTETSELVWMGNHKISKIVER